jgi:ribose transport system permease protein
MAHDGLSFMFAETWGCRVSRYFFGGPKAGTVEPAPLGRCKSEDRL